jgi:hypothetical protein
VDRQVARCRVSRRHLLHRRLPGGGCGGAGRQGGDHPLDRGGRLPSPVSAGAARTRAHARRRWRRDQLRWCHHVPHAGHLPDRALRQPRPGGAGLQGDAGGRRAPKPAALRRLRPRPRPRRPAHPQGAVLHGNPPGGRRLGGGAGPRTPASAPERSTVASRPPPARRPAATCSGSASRRPNACSKPPPTPSTTSDPKSATATRRRSDARSPRPPGWVLDSTDTSTARDHATRRMPSQGGMSPRGPAANDPASPAGCR